MMREKEEFIEKLQGDLVIYKGENSKLGYEN